MANYFFFFAAFFLVPFFFAAFFFAAIETHLLEGNLCAASGPPRETSMTQALMHPACTPFAEAPESFVRRIYYLSGNHANTRE